MTNLSSARPLHLDQMAAGKLIDCFVECVEGSSRPAFTRTLDRTGQMDTSATHIGLFLAYLERMYNHAMSEDVESSSEKLRTFREAFRGIGIEPGLGETVFLDESEGRYLTPEEMMNLLVKRIRLNSQALLPVYR